MGGGLDFVTQQLSCVSSILTTLVAGSRGVASKIVAPRPRGVTLAAYCDRLWWHSGSGRSGIGCKTTGVRRGRNTVRNTRVERDMQCTLPTRALDSQADEVERHLVQQISWRVLGLRCTETHGATALRFSVLHVTDSPHARRP